MRENRTRRTSKKMPGIICRCGTICDKQKWFCADCGRRLQRCRTECIFPNMLQSSSAQVRDEEVADGMMTAHKQLNLSDGSTLNEANTNGNNAGKFVLVPHSKFQRLVDKMASFKNAMNQIMTVFRTIQGNFDALHQEMAEKFMLAPHPDFHKLLDQMASVKNSMNQIMAGFLTIQGEFDALQQEMAMLMDDLHKDSVQCEENVKDLRQRDTNDQATFGSGVTTVPKTSNKVRRKRTGLPALNFTCSKIRATRGCPPKRYGQE